MPPVSSPDRSSERHGVEDAPDVVLVYSDRHSARFIEITTRPWPDVPIYIVRLDGSVRTLRGPPVLSLAMIHAKHVVWVGIPMKWVNEKVRFSDLIRSHFVGTKLRFMRVQNTVMVHRAIELAHESIEAAREKVVRQKKRAVEAQEKERADAIEALRRRRLGEPAPWYIPPCLM